MKQTKENNNHSSEEQRQKKGLSRSDSQVGSNDGGSTSNQMGKSLDKTGSSDTLKKIFEEIKYFENKTYEKDTAFNEIADNDILRGLYGQAKGYIQRTKEELERLRIIESKIKNAKVSGINEGVDLIDIYHFVKEEINNRKEIIKLEDRDTLISYGKFV